MSHTKHASYDEAPYPFLSHSNTHPDRLAVIATLLNLDVAPVQNCRVLEIGCAVGGNLIPMAEALPDSQFVGIDNASKQIQQAQELATALDLQNIAFHTMDILNIDSELGAFDYIIAHGIYSWVPANVREKLLEICRQNLAPDGIAYISYNVLPGYHMMSMIREMMLWHTRSTESHRQPMSDA